MIYPADDYYKVGKLVYYKEDRFLNKWKLTKIKKITSNALLIYDIVTYEEIAIPFVVDNYGDGWYFADDIRFDENHVYKRLDLPHRYKSVDFIWTNRMSLWEIKKIDKSYESEDHKKQYGINWYFCDDERFNFEHLFIGNLKDYRNY